MNRICFIGLLFSLSQLSVMAGTVRLNLPNTCQSNAGTDQYLCALDRTQLAAELINPRDQGSWTQSEAQEKAGVQILDANAPNTKIKGLKPGQQYEFTWTVKHQDCTQSTQDEVTIHVSPLQEADAGDDQLACASNTVLLEADLPKQASGFWTSMNASVELEGADEPTALAMDLKVGRNGFVWTVHFPECEHTDSDTVWIEYVEELALNPIELPTEMNEALLIDPTVLVQPTVREELTFSLADQPAFGELTDFGNARYEYRPLTDFSGFDAWHLKACWVQCPSLCTELELVVKVADEVLCKVPSIITPNGDGANDRLEVPCLDQFPDAELVIFSGRGEQVFRQRPYRNNWEGRYNGEDLPPGTYFYVLDLNNRTNDMVQGFFVIHR
ncbi:MAG: gliding motility-associated C-terminal domain-containing protein [Bacteroidota bacterium]